MQGKGDMTSGSFLLRRAIYEDKHGKKKEEQEDETVQGEELVETDGLDIRGKEIQPDAEQRRNSGKDDAAAIPER
jgi:hypothetical protein